MSRQYACRDGVKNRPVGNSPAEVVGGVPVVSHATFVGGIGGEVYVGASSGKIPGLFGLI